MAAPTTPTPPQTQKTLQDYKQNLGLLTKCASAGAGACVAEVATFPVDLLKVRLQISGEVKPHKQAIQAAGRAVAKSQHKIFRIMKEIIHDQGFKGLFSGVTPGIHRQLIYASLRLGTYDKVKDFYASGGQQTLLTRILASATTGAFAIVGAQPTEVVKIRLQAHTDIKAYTSAFQAYRHIYKHEGVRGLWQGLGPNMVRNVTINVCELVVYDATKETLIQRWAWKDNILTHFASGLTAGFFATCVVSPIDVVKTRYMNSRFGEYKGVMECAIRTFKSEGPLAFYKGFFPAFARIGSWNIVCFLCFEQFKEFFAKWQYQKHGSILTS